RPGITAAQRADDQVVTGCGVLEGNHGLALPARVAERSDGSGGVPKEPVAKLRIDPRPRDHPRAIAWPGLPLIGVDQDIERRRIDVSLLRQDRPQRLDPPLHLAGPAVFRMAVASVGRDRKSVV